MSQPQTVQVGAQQQVYVEREVMVDPPREVVVEEKIIGGSGTYPVSGNVVTTSEVHRGMDYHPGEKSGYNAVELHGAQNGKVRAHHHVTRVGTDGVVVDGGHSHANVNVKESRVVDAEYVLDGRQHGTTVSTVEKTGATRRSYAQYEGSRATGARYTSGTSGYRTSYNEGAYRSGNSYRRYEGKELTGRDGLDYMPASHIGDVRRYEGKELTGRDGLDYMPASHIETIPAERRSIRKSEKIIKGEPRLVDTIVVADGEFKVIDEIAGSGKIISTAPRESVVTGTTEGVSRIISESITGSKITGTDYHKLEEHRFAPQIKHVDISKQVVAHQQNPKVVERVVEKEIEVLTEKPVPNYVEKIVPYDVIVEKPVEKIIEKEVIKEVIVEKPIEKIVEVAIEKIVEVPIEKIIEKPVHIQEIVEVPIEKIITEEVEHLVEVPVYNEIVKEIDYRDIHKYDAESILPTKVTKEVQEVHVDKPYYVDNIIKNRIEHPVDNVIEHLKTNEVKKEVFTEVEVPHYEDNVIVEEVIREVPVIKTVQKEVHVEKPIKRINEVTKRIPVETITEKIVHVDKPEYVEREVRVEREVINEIWQDKIVEVEHVVRKPVEIEEIIEHEVIHENIIERPVEKVVERKYDVVIEERREVPVPRIEVIDRPYDVIIEEPREVVIEHPVENVIVKEKIVDNVIERKVREVREVVREYENVIENLVYKDNIIEQDVIYETTVQRPYDNIITKEVIVEVPKDVIKKVEVRVERPIKQQVVVENEVIQEKIVGKDIVKEVMVDAEVDMNLQIELTSLRASYEAAFQYQAKLEEELRLLRIQWENDDVKSGYWYEQVRIMIQQIADIERQIRERERALKTSKRMEKTVTTVYVDHPRVIELRELIQARKNEIAQKQEKTRFHEKRIGYGTGNYRYEDQHGERKVRLSERNKQNERAFITNVYAEITNVDVRREIEEAVAQRKTQKDVDLIVETYKATLASMVPTHK